MHIDLSRFFALVVGGGLAATGISGDLMNGLITIGVIVVSYTWIEWRMERIVRRELKVHTDNEIIWREATDKKLDAVIERLLG